jgi:hypothetical protein
VWPATYSHRKSADGLTELSLAPHHQRWVFSTGDPQYYWGSPARRVYQLAAVNSKLVRFQVTPTRRVATFSQRVAVSSKNIALNQTLILGAPACGSQRSHDAKIKRVKRSSVSTGQLRQLLVVHLRPINLVVFQGTLGLRQRNLILETASCLYAFSTYPSHT